MKVTDATVDRIQQRREKLERKGILKENIPGSDVTAHLWQADKNGLLTKVGEHEGPGIPFVVIPSGKFITIESVVVPAMSEEQWITGFAHLEDLPEMPLRVSPLIDAPPAPEFHPPVIERVPDATIATGDDPNAHDRPLGVRPHIDRDAVLLDLEKFRKERGAGDAEPKPKSKPKARTFEERARRVSEEMAAQFEAVRQAQQKTETRPVIRMAMAPTITDWKGY
ncbi:hypothetical protein HFO99_30595 [Rhizobium leguminosarum]|uniref:hypothetical protein n=1 Tax=Rhizobium leguminosarum TaxID=384 RepID=UPI001C95058E|nr:hypothetical protein [Rhizobium leguminosarum]MBY5338206.1 hypothetical protein [Rhizobium leguminosarum]